MEVNIERVKEDLSLLTKVVTEAWVIRYDNKVIQLCSGKSLWKRKNHACSALTNHCQSMYGQGYKESAAQRMGFKDGTELSHYLQNSGILKVERL